MQQEKTSLLEEMEKSSASCLAQLDEQRHENSELMVALKEAKQQLKIEHLQWQEDKSSLLADLDKSWGTYLAQLEKQKKVKKTRFLLP